MATTPADRSHEGHTLPLASFVAQRAPAHPLPRLVIDPVLPRLASLEAALLTSRPAALLLRLGIASERSIVALALAAIAAALARWRAQWRAVLWALGLGEALSRTVGLLQRQAATVDGEGKQHGRPDDDEDGTAQETQHVLSFWLFFAALSLADSLRSTPSGPSSSFTSSALSFLALPTRARATLQSARRTYLHFVRLWILPSFFRLRWAGRALVAKYPRLDPAPRLAYWTAFPYAFPRLYPSPSSSPAAPTRRAAGNFPQPRSRPWDPLPTSLPLSWSYFAYPSTSSLTNPSLAPTYSHRAVAAAEARWELVRLVLLWVALRRDAWGAKSLVWDWTLAPLLGALPGGAAAAPGEPTTVLRVVREVAGPRAGATGRGAGVRASSESAQPQTSQDDPDVPLSPSGSSSSASATPRRATAATGRDYPTPSPYALAWTPPRPTAPSSSIASRPRGSAPASHASSSRTASPARSTSARAPFALQDPPAARAGTSRSGALLGASSGAARSAREHGAAASGSGRGLLSPGLSVGGSSSAGEGPRRSRREQDDDDEWDVDAVADDDSDVPPATPGEEEAEEGARRWATVLAEAHAAELLVDAEGSGELVGGVVEGERHDGEPGWSR
ncbi:hypothetical protein JCM3775_002590 [Rhodotorula graminis]